MSKSESRHVETYSHNLDCHNTYIFYFCCCPDSEPRSLVSQKFFSKTSNGTHLGSELIIPVLGFVDDSGNTITSFPTGYSYTNLYINGIIQQNGTFTIVPSALLVIGGSQLDPNDPIAIEFITQV